MAELPMLFFQLAPSLPPSITCMLHKHDFPKIDIFDIKIFIIEQLLPWNYGKP